MISFKRDVTVSRTFTLWVKNSTDGSCQWATPKDLEAAGYVPKGQVAQFTDCNVEMRPSELFPIFKGYRILPEEWYQERIKGPTMNMRDEAAEKRVAELEEVVRELQARVNTARQDRADILWYTKRAAELAGELVTAEKRIKELDVPKSKVADVSPFLEQLVAKDRRIAELEDVVKKLRGYRDRARDVVQAARKLAKWQETHTSDPQYGPLYWDLLRAVEAHDVPDDL